MRTRRKYLKTHLTRPRKAAGAKRRRQLEQRRRLIGLGVPEEQVEKMNSKEIRDLLRYPKKVEQEYSSSSGE